MTSQPARDLGVALQHQVVLVVGEASGIGFAVAQAALNERARVVVASSQVANVEQAVTRLSSTAASGLVVDVTVETDVAAAFRQITALDHLVFTAGDWTAARHTALADVDFDRARAAFDVRFWGALTAIKYAVPRMRTGGSITLTGGMVAHRPSKNSTVSGSIAGAIEHLIRSLAVELAPVRVNAVCPGYIRTNVWNWLPEHEREDHLQRATSRQPLARVGKPEELAEAYIYLMRGGYTTGQILHVDGGGTVV